MSSVIYDKQHRPVFNTYGGGTSVYVWNEKQLDYVYVDTYLNEDSARKVHPNMVRHVNRRSSPPKKRHPAVHYRPTGKCVECWQRPGSTVEREQLINAKVTTDVSRVTCRVCLDAIVILAKTQLGKGGVK